MSGFSLAPKRSTVARLRDSRILVWLGRAGFVAQGLSFGIVAFFALKLAIGAEGATVSRGTSFALLARSVLGAPLLVAMGVGFLAYAAWRLSLALLDRDREGKDASGLAKRTSDAAKAALYIGLAYSVGDALADGRSGGSAKENADTVFSWPGGRYIVAAAALAFIGAAVWNLVRGIGRTYEDELRCVREARRVIAVIAIVGFASRAVIFGLIGLFLGRAAWNYEPGQAVGLGGALHEVAAAPYGHALLFAVASGLLAFTVFCFAQARYREL